MIQLDGTGWSHTSIQEFLLVNSWNVTEDPRTGFQPWSIHQSFLSSGYLNLFQSFTLQLMHQITHYPSTNGNAVPTAPVPLPTYRTAQTSLVILLPTNLNQRCKLLIPILPPASDSLDIPRGGRLPITTGIYLPPKHNIPWNL